MEHIEFILYHFLVDLMLRNSATLIIYNFILIIGVFLLCWTPFFRQVINSL